MGEKTIKEHLRELRIRHGYTQRELCKTTGICRSTISRCETSDYYPPLDVCIILADVYGVSVDEIIMHEVKPKAEIKYLDVHELAQETGVSTSTIHLYNRIGIIKSKTSKGKCFFEKSMIEKVKAYRGAKDEEDGYHKA